MKYAIIKFSKPTHETDNRYWVNLRVELVERAKKNKEMIVLDLPQGLTEPIEPKDLLKHGNRTEAAYLYPNNPMRLVGQYFTIASKEQQTKILNNDLIQAIL